MLKGAGITPNATKSYTFAALDKAISDKLNVNTIRYWCNEIRGKQIIYRLGVCFGKNFAPKDCPGGEFEKSCDKDTEFYLIPHSAHFRHVLDRVLLVLLVVNALWAW